MEKKHKNERERENSPLILDELTMILTLSGGELILQISIRATLLH